MSNINYRDVITIDDVKYVAAKFFKNQEIEVINYTIAPYSHEKIGFLSTHQRLDINVKKKQNLTVAIVLQSFFVKAIPYDVPSQAMNVKSRGVFDQEAAFFAHIVPELTKNYNGELWGPKCYLVKHDALVFEDLSELGFKMKDKLFDEKLIKSGLRALANMHASSLIAEERMGKTFKEIWPNAFKERAFLTTGDAYKWYRAGVDVAIKIAEDMHLNTNLISAACNKVFNAMQPSMTKQNVVSHGDLWSNNLLFDDHIRPKCRLVDFQLLRYSPLAHDIAQFMYLCASRKLRDLKGKKLLRYYYEELLKCLKINYRTQVAQPSWQDVLDGWEEQKLAAVVTAIMYFPTVLLDGLTGAEIMNDDEKYAKFVLCDRRDVVIANMKRDEIYGERLREIVGELVEMSMQLDDYPSPS